ncbi:MAG: ABC transporter ATP-binding protein [Planctomycetes bacterium]|nr:ABC transporter ATP-binding protein [Planctomycetota bacterium]
MKKLIEISGMTKLFPLGGGKAITALNHVSFDIFEGETFGLIGESGSGKSTAGRCILNLIPLTSGTLVYKGVEYSRLNHKTKKMIRSEMQMVFQDPYYSLNPRRSVWDTVEGTLLCRGGSKRTVCREMTEAAQKQVQLKEEDFGKYAHQLSAGQQQRVGIARAMAANPKFVVLDEPTSSLDVSVRAEIIDLLRHLQEKLGSTYLFISHDLSTVEHLCHRVAILYLGSIVEYGTVEQVFHRHLHPYSKALMASVMPADPDAKKNEYALSGEIPSAIDMPPGCHLAGRCPEAERRCFEECPPMIEAEPGHLVKCHHVKPCAQACAATGELALV